MQTVQQVTSYITARLKEPSTWAGLAVIVLTISTPFVPPAYQAVLQALVAALGGTAVALPEKS